MKNKLIITLLALVIAMGCFIGGVLLGGKRSETRLDAAVIESSLNDIAELATVEYSYTNLGKFENQLELYGWKVPFTTSKIIISYDGIIKAGIDCRSITVKVTDKAITVTLPQAAILSHTIDFDSLQVMDETYSIFNPIKITDYNQFYADQSGIMEEKAIARGILKVARDNAVTSITSMLKNAFGNDIEVIIR